MEKEAETKIQETKDNAQEVDNKEEVPEMTPLVNSENDQATEDNNSAETWGQWFATKLSLPPGSFRDTLTDPNLSDKLKDQAKEIKDKVKEGVTNTYNKVDDFSNRLKEK